jgi:hypothetical protein
MAAVLACGPGAVLSHRGAAGLWGIRGGNRLEVTVPGSRKSRRGIEMHLACLPDDETTTHHGIQPRRSRERSSTSVLSFNATSYEAR